MSSSGHRDLLSISLALIVLLLVGDVAYTLITSEDYSAEVSLDTDTVSYELVSVDNEEYSVVVSDNGGHSRTETVYLYLDTSRPSAVGCDQEAVLEELRGLLELRGIDDIEYVDAQGLADALRGDVRSGDCAGKGLVVVSGVLPSTVYTGSESNLIFRWMSAGGSLYWAGGTIGELYATSDVLRSVSGYEELFFGAECLNDGDAVVATESAGGYTSMLGLESRDLTGAVDVGRVGEGRDALGIGYTADGYTTVSLVQYGDGMVCVFGGSDPAGEVRDMAQIVASGLGPSSQAVGYVSGSVDDGMSSGSVTLSAVAKSVVAYVYMGGSDVVYGEAFSLRRRSVSPDRGLDWSPSNA